MVDLLNRNRNSDNILNEEVPDIDAPILRSMRYQEPKRETPTSEQKQKENQELKGMLGLRKTRNHLAFAIPKIKNEDNQCFKWSVLRHFHPTGKTNPERVSSLTHHEINSISEELIFP